MSSRQIAIGPEALISILVGNIIRKISDDAALSYTPQEVATVLCFLVGVFTSGLGIFRLGFLDSVLSRALLRGFITATAVVIVIEQLPLLTAVIIPSDVLSTLTSPFSTLLIFLSHSQEIHLPSLALSCCSVLFLVAMRYVKRLARKKPSCWFICLIPEILVLTVISIILSAVWDWPSFNIQVLGKVEGGQAFPPLTLPHLSLGLVREVFLDACLLSVIGFVESIAIAKTYGALYNYPVSPNRELVALGMSNLFSSLLGAYPSFGSLARSRVNNTSGARTQMAGFISGALMLITILFIVPFFEYLPKPVMSSIILLAAFGLLELHDFQFIYKVRAWKEGVLLMLTFFITLFVSIEAGTMISIGLSLILVIRHTTRPRVTILGKISGSNNRFAPVEDLPGETEHIEGVLIVRIQEPLIFANTGQLKDRLRRCEQFGDISVHPSEEATHQPISCIIFDIDNMPQCDASAIQILCEIVEEYHSRDISVLFVRLRDQNKELFIRSGIVQAVGSDCFFRKISDAIRFFEQGGNIRSRSISPEPFHIDIPVGRQRSFENVRYDSFSSYAHL